MGEGNKTFGMARIISEFRKLVDASEVHKKDIKDSSAEVVGNKIPTPLASVDVKPQSKVAVSDPESFNESLENMVGSFATRLNEFMGHHGDFTRHCYEKDEVYDDIKPLTAAQTAGFSAALTLSLSNGISRQAVTNLKTLFDTGVGKKLSVWDLVKQNPKRVFTEGMTGRLGYLAFGAYPAIEVRSQLTKAGRSPWEVSLGASLTETVFRSMAEYSRITKTAQAFQATQMTGVQKFEVMNRTFAPFLLRNGVAWCIINNSPDPIHEKMLCGFVSGVAGTPLETFGNLVMKHSPNSKTLVECYKKSFEDLKSGERTEIQNLTKRLFSLCHYRGMAGALTILLLSKGTEESLAKEILPYFESIAQKLKSKEIKDVDHDSKPRSEIFTSEGEEVADITKGISRK